MASQQRLHSSRPLRVAVVQAALAVQPSFLGGGLVLRWQRRRRAALLEVQAHAAATEGISPLLSVVIVPAVAKVATFSTGLRLGLASPLSEAAALELLAPPTLRLLMTKPRRRSISVA